MLQGILGLVVILLPFGLIGMFMARRRFRTRLYGFVWGFFGGFVGFFFGGMIAVAFDAPVMQALLMGLMFAPAGLLMIWARRPAAGPPCRECGKGLKLAWEPGKSKPVAANVCWACAAEQAPGSSVHQTPAGLSEGDDAAVDVIAALSPNDLVAEAELAPLPDAPEGIGVKAATSHQFRTEPRPGGGVDVRVDRTAPRTTIPVGTPITLPPPPPATHRGWRRWRFVVGGIALAVIVVAGVLLWPRASAPLPPTGLRATDVSVGLVELTWAMQSEGPRPDAFRVGRDGETIDTIEVALDRQDPTFSFTDDTAEPGASYAYSVVAMSGDEESLISEVQVDVPEPPLAVMELRATRPAIGEVVLTWRADPNGTRPDAFRVLRDGTKLGQVAAQGSGPLPRYTDRNAVPGTTYVYSVVALAGGGTSAPRDVWVRIPLPPLGAARLSGSFHVKGLITARNGFPDLPNGFTASWTFKPQCASGACATRVAGSVFGYTWSSQLEQNGARYTGTSKIGGARCDAVPVTDTVSLTLEVTKARFLHGEWRATAWSGTIKETFPYTSLGMGYCPSAYYTATVRGS